MANPQAGWYPDPSGDPLKQRYWDGTQWTNDYAQAQTGSPQPQVIIEETSYDNPDGSRTTVDQVYYQQPVQRMENNSDQTMRLTAFVFCVVSTFLAGWAIIPLAWMIPMTVHCWRIYQGRRPNTVGFGVCTLIFVSLVSGIFLLVSKKD